MEITRGQILRAAVELFLKQGYHDTKVSQIAEKIDKSTAVVFRAYPDKEAILYALVNHMFGSQFSNVRKKLGDDAEQLMVYGVETALQLHICELSEALRDVYVTAYTLPSTSEYIYQQTAKTLQRTFAEYLPDASESDFYEMEIASGSVMRGYMTKKCDMYFSMSRKISLFLGCCLSIYKVPEEKQNEVIENVLSVDIETMAREVIDQVVRRAEEGFSSDIINALPETEAV